MNPLVSRIVRTPSMWPAAAAVLWSLLLRRRFAMVRRHGMWTNCGTQGGQGAFCAIAGLDYEPELRWVLQQLMPGDVFIDVGANIGIYSLHAAQRVGNTGQVFSIEPSRDAAAVLRRNIASNKFTHTVEVINAAVSNRQGSLFLSGCSEQWNSLHLSNSPPGERIDVVTLDKVCNRLMAENQKRVRCIKIDAEGVELEVLQGAEETLKTYRPSVVFEDTFEATRDLASTWLQDHGYRIGSIDSSGKLTLTPRAVRHESANLVAVYSHKAR